MGEFPIGSSLNTFCAWLPVLPLINMTEVLVEIILLSIAFSCLLVAYLALEKPYAK